MQYMLLFRGLAANPQASDQPTADYNWQWGQWMANLAERHALLAGAPFHAGGKVITGAEVADLELQPVDIGGFALIEVDSEEAALEVAKTAPARGARRDDDRTPGNGCGGLSVGRAGRRR